MTVYAHSLFAAAAAAFATTAATAATVTIDHVQQRWPWNNKVDITYTVTGGQTRAAGVYCALRFALTANGRTYGFEGYTVGASAENGSHTVTWTAPKGIVSTDCSLVATLFTTNIPSGNDYMIVNLENGAVIYEGLFATQDESNARYNTDGYKTGRMVLRKVPKWTDRDTLPNAADLASQSGYPTGDNMNYGSGKYINTEKTWATERDYYIGVFPVTQFQYARIGADAGNTPSLKTSTVAGNPVELRPVEQVSWNDLRLSDTAPTSAIPAVATANSGTFFQRLNFLTGNGYGFDLPTEVMFEIAERSGATTTFYWGGTADPAYVVCSANSGGSTVAVGSRLPNNWGLYDTAGNLWEWCLDGRSGANNGGIDMTGADAFTPYNGSEVGTLRRQRGGGYYNDVSDAQNMRASFRAGDNAGTRGYYCGFRVAMIVD